MYKNKNTAFSSTEIIISLSIFFMISSILFNIISPSMKIFKYIHNDYKREKEIMSFREIIHSNFNWNESAEIRLLEINESIDSLDFNQIFLNESKNKGNLLIIKYNFLEKLEISYKLSIQYKYFCLYEDSLRIGYFEEEDSYIYLGDILQHYPMITNFEGHFTLNDNILKISYEDKKRKKKYEEIIYYKQK